MLLKPWQMQMQKLQISINFLPQSGYDIFKQINVCLPLTKITQCSMEESQQNMYFTIYILICLNYLNQSINFNMPAASLEQQIS